MMIYHITIISISRIIVAITFSKNNNKNDE